MQQQSMPGDAIRSGVVASLLSVCHTFSRLRFAFIFVLNIFICRGHFILMVGRYLKEWGESYTEN